MLKKRYSKPGSSPATLTPHLAGGVAKRAEIHMIRYAPGTLEEKALPDLGEADANPGGVTWIDVGSARTSSSRQTNA